MLKKLARIFERRHIAPPVSQPLSAENIYLYITELEKSDRDRLDDEIRNRGLRFGDLRIDDHGFGIRFCVSYEKSNTVQLEDVEDILHDIIAQKEWFGVVVEKDGRYTLNVILGDHAPKSLRGIQVSGWSSEEEDAWGSRWPGEESSDPQQRLEIRSSGGEAQISCEGGGTTYQKAALVLLFRYFSLTISSYGV